MRILLDVGKAGVDVLSSYSTTAVHYAAKCGHIEAAAFLIVRGAKVNLVANNVYTPLVRTHSVYCNSAQIIDFLQSKGAKRVSELQASS